MAMPLITRGRIIGASRIAVSERRKPGRRRARPIAAMVPSATERTATELPTTTLLRSASRQLSLSKKASYQRVEKPASGKVK